jgi:integrase
MAFTNPVCQVNTPASVKTTQDLLRHSSPVMTLGVYAKAVTAEKRAAQDVIAAMVTAKNDVHVAAD